MARKAEAGRPDPGAPLMTAERAISQALSRAAGELFDLPLAVSAIRERRMTLSDLPELLEELSLLALIEGPQETLGLLALPPATLATLIEVQMTGRVGRAVAPPRRPTRVDAAMAAEFVDAVLEGIEDGLEGMEEQVWAGGYRYASHLDDPRPLGLLLEDLGYRVWQIDLVLGPAPGRPAGLLWAVPAQGHFRRQPVRPTAGAPAAPAPESDAAEAADWARRMEGTVMGTQAVLEAVLHRVTLPLATVMTFGPGTCIPLPEDALERLSLEGAGRRRLAPARLGQHRGFRALRISSDEDEAALPQAAKPLKMKTAPPFEPGPSPFAAAPAPGTAAAGMGALGLAMDWDGDAGEAPAKPAARRSSSA
ncbi:FliM/FliN family flagellar motor C-terminal domain-containing protein [Paenirhodobacter hankyongi]|uniref:FliM/FliN family flagellar motor C-terminal domain-containing protein n=1 Tax=Paenirhodobacter hankyongi TaxID=2294033 RepID=UPI0016043145|nr:FliM/FliN family flagellar motor C-terminal domain-containing protein [Sinirhodobacter hankyongi]